MKVQKFKFVAKKCKLYAKMRSEDSTYSIEVFVDNPQAQLLNNEHYRFGLTVFLSDIPEAESRFRTSKTLMDAVRRELHQQKFFIEIGKLFFPIVNIICFEGTSLEIAALELKSDDLFYL